MRRVDPPHKSGDVPEQTEEARASAAEAIVRNLFQQFDSQAKRKIAEFAALFLQHGPQDVDWLPQAVAAAQSDTHFEHLLQALSAIAKHCLDSMVEALLEWRMSQITGLGHWIASLRSTRSAFRSSIRDAQGPRGSEERALMGVDFVFCQTLLVLLRSYRGDNLSERLYDEVEDFCFTSLREGKTSSLRIPTPSVSSFQRRWSVMEHNAPTAHRHLSDLYSDILSIISQHRLGRVMSRLFGEVEDALGKLPWSKVATMARRIACLRLDITSETCLQDAVTFMRRVLNVMERSKKELKIAVCEAAARVLDDLADAPLKKGVDYTQWESCLMSVLALATEWSKKTKYSSVAHQLMTATLALVEKEVFLKSYSPLMDTLVKSLKEKQACAPAVQSLKSLLRTALTKHARDIDQLQHVVNSIFFSGKARGPLHQDVSQEELVEIVGIIASSKISFALESIVTETMNAEVMSDQVAVGLRACQSIFQRLNSKRVTATSPLLQSVGSTGLIATSEEISPFIPRLGKRLGKILMELDDVVGKLVSTNHSKGITDLSVKERTGGLMVLRHAISCVPFLLPQEIPLGKLVAMFSNFSIHQDEEVAKGAREALKLLVELHPKHRAQVVYGVADTVLALPGESQSEIKELLKLLLVLLHTWLGDKETKRGPAQLASSGMSVHVLLEKLESLGLVCLCNMSARIRFRSFQLLRSSRDLAALIFPVEESEEEEEEEVPHVVDVFEESGSDIVTRCWLDTFRIVDYKVDLSSIPVKYTLEGVAVRDDNAPDQLRWARCLPELLKVLEEVLPDVVFAALKEVRRKIALLLPQLEPKRGAVAVSAKDELKLHQWRNYILFACAATVVDEPNTDHESASVITARLLFREIVSLIRSDLEPQRKSAVMGLGRTHVSALAILFDELDHIHREAFVEVDSDRSRDKRKKKEVLRHELVHLYRLLLEGIKQSDLETRVALREHILSKIEDVERYLRQPSSFLWEHIFMRYNFCLAVQHMASEIHGIADADELFTREFRKRLFLLLSSWCGYGPNTEHQKWEEMIQKIQEKLSEDAKDALERVALEETFHYQMQCIELVALKAMSTLLLGPAFDDDAKQARGIVFAWINEILGSAHEQVRGLAQAALQMFLQRNLSCLPVCLSNCYSTDPMVARCYFLTFVEVFVREEITSIPFPVLLNLSFFKLLDPSYLMRNNAVMMFRKLVSRFDEYVEGISYSFSITSTLDDSYKKFQFQLSSKLAGDHPEMTLDLFAEVLLRMKQVDSEGQERMMSYLSPWMCNLTFTGDEEVEDSERSVVENLILLTMTYYKEHPGRLSDIWTMLADVPSNVEIVLEYVLSFCEQKFSYDQEFMEILHVCKKIVIYLGRVNAQDTIDTLVRVIQLKLEEGTSEDKERSKGLPERRPRRVSTHAAHASLERIRPLSTLDTGRIRRSSSESFAPQFGEGEKRRPTSIMTPTPSTPQEMSLVTPFGESTPPTTPHEPKALQRRLTRAEFGIILIVDLVYETDEEFRAHAPLLLHVAIICMDHQHPLIPEHCKNLLVNMIHSLVVRHLAMQGTPETLEERETAMGLIDNILSKEGKALWQREDRTIQKSDIQGSAELCRVVETIMQVMDFDRDLGDRWASEALRWATNATDLHLASRSHQVYRTLHPKVTCESSLDILDSLGKCIADPTSKKLGFLMEILLTLQVIVESMDTHKIILFPQLFWGSVALLHTDFVHVYLHVLDLLTKIVERLNFSDTATQTVLLASLPKGWDPPFVGIQPLIVKGLTHPITEQQATKLLSAITLMPADAIFDPTPNRLVLNMVGLLPHLCYRLDQGKAATEARRAEKIMEVCERTNYNRLAKIFSRYAKDYYTNLDAFLTEFHKSFADAFLPRFAEEFLLFCVQVLERGPPRYNRVVLVLLHSIIPHIDLNTTEMQGIRLFPVLSSFLECDLWQEALAVLDVAVHMSSKSISALPVLRISSTAKTAPIPKKKSALPLFESTPKVGTVRSIKALAQVVGNVIETQSLQKRSVLLPLVSGEESGRLSSIEDEMFFLDEDAETLSELTHRASRSGENIERGAAHHPRAAGNIEALLATPRGPMLPTVDDAEEVPITHRESLSNLLGAPKEEIDKEYRLRNLIRQFSRMEVEDGTQEDEDAV